MAIDKETTAEVKVYLRRDRHAELVERADQRGLRPSTYIRMLVYQHLSASKPAVTK